MNNKNNQKNQYSKYNGSNKEALNSFIEAVQNYIVNDLKVLEIRINQSIGDAVTQNEVVRILEYEIMDWFKPRLLSMIEHCIKQQERFIMEDIKGGCIKPSKAIKQTNR